MRRKSFFNKKCDTPTASVLAAGMVLYLMECIEQINICRNAGYKEGASKYGTYSDIYGIFNGLCEQLRKLGNVQVRRQTARYLREILKVQVHHSNGVPAVVSRLEWLLAHLPNGQKTANRLLLRDYPYGAPAKRKRTSKQKAKKLAYEKLKHMTELMMRRKKYRANKLASQKKKPKRR